MKHFVLMCLLLYIHTSQSQIHHQNSTVGGDVILYCKHEGKVVWSKGRDGYRLTILTAKSKDEIQKHITDPHNRYSVIDDLSLHIKNFSLSDSGIYYCNANATVNLTVTAPDSSKPNTSSNNQTEATIPPAETSITSVSQTSNTHHPHQPNSSQDVNARSTSSSTRIEETDITKSKSNTSSTSIESPTPPPTESSKIAVAVSGGVVFVVLVLVLVLLLWAWIKRNAALSNKKENIYETAEDSDFTAQPVPMQKPNDAIYYLAGDPDIVELGQIKEMDDPTYTLISQPKENITEQEGDVPLYSP